jgi:hypothetical protein
MDGAAPVSGTGTDRLRAIESTMDYGLIPVEPGTECPRDALRICRLLGLERGILDAIEAESGEASEKS